MDRLVSVTIETMSRADVQELYDQQQRRYDALKTAGLALDITRGKPSSEQLDLSNALLTLPGDQHLAGKVDVRNYGGNAGLPQLREIFAELLGVPANQLVAEDNASLSIMHDTIVWGLLHGMTDSPRPWSAEEKVKFICPTPGYDRHFAICQRYGIEMVSVDMLDDGPDMAAVRELVGDPAVKGMWLVPTYSNPSGAVVSEEIAAELASLETTAPDFRIYWDNAYAVHHLTAERTKSADILGLCVAAGHPDRPLIFGSTSKITFAGAGVSFLGGSPDNIAWYLRHAAIRTIGPDKVNQLRHAIYLRDAEGVLELMDAHARILTPKFEAVEEILTARLSGTGVGSWTKPKGGYFVSLDVAEGTATRVVQLAKEAGIALTPAGAAYPYGKDPRDRHLRIAPTFPPLNELREAMEGLCTCVLLAAAEQALS